ncbi:MAG TPA: serine hydrolase [Luteimonas sp.]|nr:serine hydrolase [Luteimonas sp.]
MMRLCMRPLAAVGLLCLAFASAGANPASPSGAGETAQAPSDAQIVAKVDEYMRAAVEFDQFTGSILVARNGTPIISKGYGRANYEWDVPNTSDTVFQIASLTKQFTATAIMQLQEQGKLKVGDPVCNYVDDCPPAWRPITLRHLLTHTSGIKNFSSLPGWDEDLGRRTYRRAELVDLFRDLPLEFAPGEKYKYSNSGYVLLGLVIERASGKSYGKFLHDGIFAPLGMARTAFDDNRTLISGRAAGYYSRGTDFVFSPYNLDPTTQFAAAGVTTTTRDLLVWDQALYTEKLLSQKSLDEMFTPFKNNYGYGWQTGEKLGRRKLDHSGSNDGFSSYMIRFPDDRVTVIVLSNSDRTSAGKAGTNLASIVFGAPYKLPEPQLRDLLWQTIVEKGAEAGIRQYRELKRTEPKKHDFGDETLIDLGYDLLDSKRIAEAAAIFRFNLEMFPRSAYSYDGFADIAIEQGDKKKAAAYFEKSLSIDPDNDYASEALDRLQRGNMRRR